ADITTGTFPDARVAETNVTQHQAALSIAAGQLTGTIAGVNIAAEAVSVDKLQHINTARILGRTSAGIGDVEVLDGAAVRGAINVEDGATADQTGAEIKVAYEAEADTNAFADADVTKLGLAVPSNIAGISGADQITNMVSLTQVEYDAIGTPDASTFYVIAG
ncbi:MAG: hypothetical protein KJO69_06675, partial [Gammaproteobacteria bacterium]|nr:hypothetical protein [Gammaproteobacteria bacterium]